jgi:hypothetical protein
MVDITSQSLITKGLAGYSRDSVLGKDSEKICSHWKESAGLHKTDLPEIKRLCRLSDEYLTECEKMYAQ